MDWNKGINFQYLFFFFLISLSFVSFSYAGENVSIKGQKMTSDQSAMPILSDEQVAQCIEKIKLADQSVYKLDEQAGKLEHLKNNLDKLKQNIETKRAHLDWHNQDSVQDYNQMKKEQNLLYQDYRSDAENYNHAVEQYKINIETLKVECSDKRYFENKATTILSQ